MIRKLKGTLPFGYKGIFITTAKFSTDAKSESNNDSLKPIVLIDGYKLVESYIEHDFCVTFIPIFSSQSMKYLLNKNLEKKGT